MDSTVNARIVREGDFVKLTVVFPKKEIKPILHVVADSSNGFYYRRDLGISNITKASPYGVIIGKKKGEEIDGVVIPREEERAHVTITSVVSQEVMEEFLKSQPTETDDVDKEAVKRRMLVLFGEKRGRKKKELQ